MEWLDTEADFEVPSAIAISLLLTAIEKHPDNPLMHERLGDALFTINKITDAVSAYERAARLAPSNFGQWVNLADCYLRLGRAEAALDACRRCEDAHGTALPAKMHFHRGRALYGLRSFSDAKKSFMCAVLAGSHFLALRILLAPLAKEPSGEKLLDFCDSLPEHYIDSALVRAHRAIALSRMGRTDEALQIVDLARHVSRIAFAPPSEFEGLEQFNRELADSIIAKQSTATTVNRPTAVTNREGFEIDYEPPQLRDNRALSALRAFMKSAITQYLEEMNERRLNAVMPPPPAKGRLFEATVVLRGRGRNGEHVHDKGYVSVVYHVLVPDNVTRAGDDRGALMLGCCERYTGGYTPCWGTRCIRPVAGWLTIFPSHIYHDVVPTRTGAPRVSVAADLRAC